MLSKGDRVVFEDANGELVEAVVARNDGSGMVIVRFGESNRAREVPVSKIRDTQATKEERS